MPKISPVGIFLGGNTSLLCGFLLNMMLMTQNFQLLKSGSDLSFFCLEIFSSGYEMRDMNKNEIDRILGASKRVC